MAETFHETDERLELYALNRLSDSDVVPIEEHLLVCDSCRNRLEQNAIFAFAVIDELKKKPAPRISAASWGQLSLWPRFAMAGAFAVAVLAVVFLWSGTKPIAPVATIQLTAMRGTEAHSVRESRELDLSFSDANASPLAGKPMVEVVDSVGGAVWRGSPEIAAGTAEVRIRKVLAPGDYFARYYDSPGHLLHEYAFGVKK